MEARKIVKVKKLTKSRKEDSLKRNWPGEWRDKNYYIRQEKEGVMQYDKTRNGETKFVDFKTRENISLISIEL